MKVAVTGATGHLGQHVVIGLLERLPPQDVIAVARNREKTEVLAQRGAVVRMANYGDPESLKKAFAGAEKVLLISSSEIGQRIEQHRNVIEAAKAKGVNHIAYTSAPQAATTSLIVAPEHKATEELIFQCGMQYTILRNNWYTENYLQDIEIAGETGAIVASVGEGRVASASRVDYAAGAIAVLLGQGHEGKIYEFGGDYAWDYNELAEAIGDIINKPVVYQSVDTQTRIENLKNTGMDEAFAELTAVLDDNIKDGLLSEVTGHLSDLIERPTTPLKKGLQDALSAI
jgi:NAD(P)H dehydrogenase (quinone)